MTPPIGITTLGLLYREGWQNRFAPAVQVDDLNNVEEYYDSLSEALRVHLMARQLLETGLFQATTSRHERAFRVITSVAECAAYAVPGGAAVAHLGSEMVKHAIEVAHLGVLAVCHGAHSVHEAIEEIHQGHQHPNQLLKSSTDSFIKALCLDLAIRFRYELRYLDTDGVARLVRLHRDYILEQVCVQAEARPPPSLNELRASLIEQLDSSPVDCAIQEIALYRSQWESRFFRKEKDLSRENYLEGLVRDLKQIRQLPDPTQKVLSVYQTARGMMVRSLFGRVRVASIATPEYSLAHPVVRSLHEEATERIASVSLLPNTFSESHLSKLFGWIGLQNYTVGMKDLMERISLLMLRQFVLLGLQRQSSDNLERELRTIMTFPLSASEAGLLAMIEQQRTQIAKNEERLQALEEVVLGRASGLCTIHD